MRRGDEARREIADAAIGTRRINLLKETNRVLRIAGLDPVRRVHRYAVALKRARIAWPTGHTSLTAVRRWRAWSDIAAIYFRVTPYLWAPGNSPRVH